MNEKIKYIIFTILVILLITLIYLIETSNTINFDDTIYSILATSITDTKTTFFSLISNLASAQFIILLCIVSLIFIKNKKTGIIISVNSLNSVILNNILKNIFRRERPIVIHLIEENSYSFPSGHAMAAMSFYGLLIYLICKSNINKYLKILFTTVLSIIILLIGISRIYLGVHYASDIIGGYLFSIIYMFIYIFIVNKIRNKQKNM